MSRTVLRWSGIGLIICALAAIIADLVISLHTLNTKPLDATLTGIAVSPLFWALAALEMSTHLRTRAEPPSDELRLRFDIHMLFLDNASLGVPLTVTAAQTAFVVVITALTIGTGLFGMVPADQRQLAGELLLAQASITVILMLLGDFLSSMRRQA